jgi:hypothetical protein
MKALVVGTDYFADRFVYLIERNGVYAKKVSKIPREPDCDVIFFSGAACTPENISLSLKAGLDVFSEQIVFGSVKDVSFVDAAMKGGLRLYLGTFDVFNPVVQQVKELLKGCGILSLRLDRVGPVSHSNISIVEDSIMHGIGTMKYILGDKAKSPEIRSHFSDKARSQFTLVMKFGGVNGIVYVSNINRYKERVIDIFCKSYRMRGDLLRQELYVLDTKKSDPNLCVAGAWSFRRYYVKKAEPLNILIKNFLHGEESPVSHDFIKGLLKTTLEVKRRLPASG